MKSALWMAFLMSSGAAVGQFSVISPPDDNDTDIAAMLGAALGGGFAPVSVGSLDYSNGTFSAIRLADFGSGNDQIWDAGTYRITTTEHEHHNHRNHQFGFVKGTSGTSGFQFLLSGINEGETKTVTIDEEFRWAAKFQQGNFKVRTSSPNDNPAGFDQMVTYQLRNQSGASAGYMIFFENEDYSPSVDGDYNDLSFMLNLVPTPSAAGLGCFGLLALAGGARRRR